MVAGDTASCRLLELPREVRNLIYKHLTNEGLVLITKAPDPDVTEICNTAHLANGSITEVFRVCKQIHDEYKDSCYKQATLFIYATKLGMTRSCFDFKPGVSKKLFSSITECHVKIPFGLLQEACDPEELRNFVEDVMDGEAEEDTFEREWTPSKNSVEQLSTMLNQLGKWIKEKRASVFVDVLLHNDMEDFESWTALRLVQAPTFADFTIDPDTAFASAGKLDLCFSTYLPLSSQITAWDIDPDSVEQDPNDETKINTTRQTDDGILYETKDSEQKCKWILFPKCRCHATDGFCGFRPCFMGLAHCCCHHARRLE